MGSSRRGKSAQRVLPANIEAAWGIRQRPGKGPKPGLSVDRIVEAGVKVAASEGLAAVSMSRIASELGAATMALYRYVDAKDHLLALMTDAVYQAAPAAPAADEGWRSALKRWAHAQLAVLRRHPWVVRLPLGGPPIMPNQVLWFERGLACLKETKLAEGEKLSVLLLVNGFVRNEATLNADLQNAASAAGTTLKEATSAYGAMLSAVIDAERFPSIAAVLASGVFDHPGEATDLDFGLERVLDGIAALIDNRLLK